MPASNCTRLKSYLERYSRFVQRLADKGYTVRFVACDEHAADVVVIYKMHLECTHFVFSLARKMLTNL